MALHHAESGELIDVAPLGPAHRETISTTLVKTPTLEVFRLVLPAGARIPQHKEPRICQLRGESTVHCLEGTVELTVNDRHHLMRPGSLIYLAAHETHALRAVTDATVLVTLLVRHE